MSCKVAREFRLMPRFCEGLNVMNIVKIPGSMLLDVRAIGRSAFVADRSKTFRWPAFGVRIDINRVAVIPSSTSLFPAQVFVYTDYPEA